MNQISNIKPIKRNPVYAVLLSFAAPGLGHIYSGKIEKGLILFSLGFILIPIALLFYLSVGPKFVYPLFIGGLVFSLLVFVYAAFDAWLITKQISPDYQLKRYNLKIIYIAMIIVSLLYPVMFTTYVNQNIIQAFKIPSSSMVPTILPGDYLLANKAMYQRSGPEQGDIVVFPHPNQRHKIFIKRIIGLPGDTIILKNNILTINNKEITQYNRNDKTYTEKNGNAVYHVNWSDTDNKITSFNEMTIPTGFCFVMGDNRSNSVDSRHFGPIPLRDIMGKAEYIYKPALSWKRFGLIGNELYSM